MVPRTATTSAPHPDAVEFVRFCYHRRRVGWPDLYDEMCAVAGRGLFRGYSADDLGGIGVGFSLFDMPALASLACRVVAEEAALRRPVTVVLSATVPMSIDPAIPIASATQIASIAAVGEPGLPAADLASGTAEERTFDVPVRLALATSGA